MTRNDKSLGWLKPEALSVLAKLCYDNCDNSYSYACYGNHLSNVSCNVTYDSYDNYMAAMTIV